MNRDPSSQVFERAAELFGLLSTPIRLRIISELCDGEKNVSQLLERIAVPQPNMSQHLGSLYRGGVLGRRRAGSQVFYRVEHAQVRGLCQALRAGVEHASAADTGRHRSTPLI